MKDRLRVALIASNRHAIRQPFAGGLEAHVWHLARNLVDAGHDVALFAAEGSDSGLECGRLAVHELTLSAAAAKDPSMPPKAFLADHHAYMRLMIELSTSAAADFDIIHNHSLHHLPVALAATLSTPMLCTLHTPPTPWLESAVQITGGTDARFVAVSRHTAHQWSHVISDIGVVPNGVDTDTWARGPGGTALVWFGRITPEKGPHLAIDAARRSGLELVLAGPIADPQYFRAEIKPELTARVTYAGHLQVTELAELVGHSAATLVTPMWDEPYGLVVAESMSCGTPVVAFARGGIPEIVDDHSGLLVAPGDVAAMAAAIPEAIALSRTAVRHRATTSCSARTMLAEYVDIYRDTIERYKAEDSDRLLHPSSRPWTSAPRGQHLHRTAPAGDSVDVTATTGPTLLRQGRSTTA
ncbi:glycosyltransferase family 4 protein [soil metagenome]